MDLRDAYMIPAAALNDGVKDPMLVSEFSNRSAAALHLCDNAREFPPADRPPANSPARNGAACLTLFTVCE